MKKKQIQPFMLIIYLVIINTPIHSVINTKHKVDSIIVCKVDFDVSTFTRVSCDNFNKYFPNRVNITLNDKDSINHLLNELAQLQIINKREFYNIDVRAKVLLCSDKDTSTVCIGRFLTYKDGKLFNTSEKLINFVEQLK